MDNNEKIRCRLNSLEAFIYELENYISSATSELENCINDASSEIKELKELIANSENSVEDVDDELFLLSGEEYERYCGNIKKYCGQIRDIWWLRSCGNEDRIKYVCFNGNINDDGASAKDHIAVRPALKTKKSDKAENLYKCGDTRMIFVKENEFNITNFTVVKIGETKDCEVWLANMPIAYLAFDSDGKTEYNIATVRKTLINLIK